MTIALIVFAVTVGVMAGCMALAWSTDHESAGAAGDMKEGQIW